MTPQELKNSILQLAIQGKLVDQRPEEGTGKELLEKILRDRAAETTKQTRTTGKAKVKSRVASRASSVSSVSSVPVVPPIPDDEKPFDIPDSWKWVRLNSISNIEAGGTPERHNPKYWNGEIPWVKIGDISSKYVTQTSEKITKAGLDNSSAKVFPSGTLLYTIFATIGTVGILKIEAATNQAIAGITAYDGIYLEYLYHVASGLKSILMAQAHGMAQLNINQKILRQAPIPLPPLAEQKRIVAKIEELLPLIDRYEKAWSKLEDFNRRFPVDMQKSVLQMAIQGKLVEQRAEEGTGEELLEKILAAKNAKSAKKNSRAESQSRREKKTSALSASLREKIPDDEKLFDIPESWEWVRFLSVVEIATNLVQPTGHENYNHIAPDNIEKGTGRLLACRTVAEDKVVSANHRFNKGQIIYSKIRPLLRKVVIAPFEGLCSADMYPLNTEIDKGFLLRYMLSDAFNVQIAKAMSSRVKMPKINQEELAKVLIPIPPLAEQKRIVAKLEELLPLCERLK